MNQGLGPTEIAEALTMSMTIAANAIAAMTDVTHRLTLIVVLLLVSVLNEACDSLAPRHTDCPISGI
jgi:hypothetical protein